MHSVDFLGILFRVATNFVVFSFALPDGASGTVAKEAQVLPFAVIAVHYTARRPRRNPAHRQNALRTSEPLVSPLTSGLYTRWTHYETLCGHERAKVHHDKSCGIKLL
jgi:hypothetical protein